ncbi:putative mitochondrial protein [Andalucia godoyi]|uniref:Putative mitochondrial protein n=1 Tax=Andalucia godoyi TaxID=505711 RepID=A0A8K0AGF2_ANDGO|nr:putative mitochondrial protein [Andalucia godoyi]|eukprot:ANDGO_00322.mRNA.1 putative mitochondrial protein
MSVAVIRLCARLVRRVSVSFVLLSSGVAYQYLSLRKQSDEHRAFVAHRLSELEETLLDDHERIRKDIVQHMDSRFEEVLSDTRVIRDIVTRHGSVSSFSPHALQ